MKKIRTALIPIFATLSLGCSKDQRPFYDAENASFIEVQSLPEDIKVPAELWDEIEKNGAGPIEAGGHGAPAASGGGHGGGEPAPAASGHGGKPPAEPAAKFATEEKEPTSIPVIFSPIGFFLKEKTDKALQRSAYHVRFPKGGGQFDLASIIGELNGSFYFALDLKEFEELTDLRIFYVSEARKRKIDDEVVGSGCNKFLDLTSKIVKAQKDKGILINTTRDRHSSIMGGHFIVTGKKDKQVFLSRISFTDSKNPQLFCKREGL